MKNLQLSNILNKLIILFILIIISYILKALLFDYIESYNQYYDFNYFNNPEYLNIIKLPKISNITKSFKNKLLNNNLLKNKLFNNQVINKRKVSESTKKFVASSYNWKCNSCNKQLDHLYEIDHIVPLYAGGTNDINNLQPLCKMCHKLKTSNDRLKYN